MADLSLDGLASGFPTEEIINQLMALEKKPIVNLEQEKYDIEQSKNAWRDVNSRLDKLKDKITQLKLSSTYNSNKTTSSDKEIATATATSDAANNSYDLTIKSTAQAQRISGDRLDNSDVSFKDEITNFPVLSNVVINGESIEISEDDTLNTLTTKINETDAKVNASIVDNHLVLESTETGIENQIGIIDDNNVLEDLGILSIDADDSVISSSIQDIADADTALDIEGSFTIEIEGTGQNATIDVTTDDTLNTINDKINNSGLTNTTSVVNGTSLEINNSDGNAIKMINQDGTDNIIQELRFGNQSTKNELQAASNAEIEVNGITGITNSSNTFSDVVDGVTFNINSDAQLDDTATISIENDTKKATTAVNEFVDQYNSVMDFINTKLDYDPETEKAGTLQGDSTLMRIHMRIRSLVTDKIDIESTYNKLSSIGIDIDRDGVMSFDSSKLTDAVKDNPEEVIKMFNANQDDDGYDGVAVKVDNYLDQLLQSNTGVIPRRVDFFDTRIDSIDDNIEDYERRLEMKRERYIEQFTAMERAISEMQSQQNWMMSQLQSTGGSSNMISSMM